MHSKLSQLCSKGYDELKALNKIDNFYDYESDFATLKKGLGKEVLQKQLSDLPADRCKKILDPIWTNKHCPTVIHLVKEKIVFKLVR